MKAYGLKHKHKRCPHCGPDSASARATNAERQRTREEIRAELLASDDSVGPLIVPSGRPPC